jgi:hypothetical protein
VEADKCQFVHKISAGCNIQCHWPRGILLFRPNSYQIGEPQQTNFIELCNAYVWGGLLHQDAQQCATLCVAFQPNKLFGVYACRVFKAVKSANWLSPFSTAWAHNLLTPAPLEQTPIFERWCKGFQEACRAGYYTLLHITRTIHKGAENKSPKFWMCIKVSTLTTPDVYED